MSRETNVIENFELFDAADHVRDEQDARALLEVALEESVEDPAVLPAALGVIARSGNMSELATTVGMSRDGLYRALSENGNPTWSTMVKVTEALGLRIEVTARSSTTATRRSPGHRASRTSRATA